ncbi:hypothetical protein Hypma_005116 [Hypsizygus marmoreus]|uniref:Uncharacterized protein n=1 Tax=Hypsizygus marmoreus TaxID=39966 RepID=A0A369JXG0_HYPMA|nr:hypothetical protein Hypma_005116 [Hypsizygus marmoreus]
MFECTCDVVGYNGVPHASKRFQLIQAVPYVRYGCPGHSLGDPVRGYGLAGINESPRRLPGVSFIGGVPHACRPCCSQLPSQQGIIDPQDLLIPRSTDTEIVGHATSGLRLDWGRTRDSGFDDRLYSSHFKFQFLSGRVNGLSVFRTEVFGAQNS